jgi:purine-nucleoside phosphorylase
MDAESLGAFEQATETFQHLQSALPPELQQPIVGIICGSGLGGLAKTVHPEPRVEIDYKQIPHFPTSTGMYKGLILVLLMSQLFWS